MVVFFFVNYVCELLNLFCFMFLIELDRVVVLSFKFLVVLLVYVIFQSFSFYIFVQIVVINIFSMYYVQRMIQYQDGEERVDFFSEELGSEEFRLFFLMFSFISK